MPQVGEVYVMAYGEDDPEPFYYLVVEDTLAGWRVLTLWDASADENVFFADHLFFDMAMLTRFA